MISNKSSLPKNSQGFYLMPYKNGFPMSCFYSTMSPSNLAWELSLCHGLRDSKLEEISSLILYLSYVYMDLNAKRCSRIGGRIRPSVNTFKLDTTLMCSTKCKLDM